MKKKFIPIHHRGKICYYDEEEVEAPDKEPAPVATKKWEGKPAEGMPPSIGDVLRAALGGSEQ